MKHVPMHDWPYVEPVIAYDPYENANRENLAFGIEGKMNFRKQNKKK